MNIVIYNYTIWALCCSAMLSTMVLRNPILLLPLGTQLKVFKVVAPLSMLMFAAWFVLGLLNFGWKTPLMGLIVGTSAALIVELFTKPRGMVHTPAILVGIIGLALSALQILEV